MMKSGIKAHSYSSAGTEAGICNYRMLQGQAQLALNQCYGQPLPGYLGEYEGGMASKSIGLDFNWTKVL